MDFNLTILNNLLNTLNQFYSHSTSIEEFAKNENEQSCIFLRHDIDKNPNNALKIAQLEHEKGIHGTYYFRIHPKVFKPEIIKRIASMGHQIGYHYEDFTTSHGNPEKAIISFQKNLENLRGVVPVATICMDGRPLSKYNNLDLWKYFNYKDYGIKTEPYLDIDFNKVLYLTDTGRGWNHIKYSVRDKVRNPFNYHDKTTTELIKDIENGNLPAQIMITLHPQRWHNNPFLWLRELLLQRAKNIVKWGLIRLRNRYKK